MLRRFTETVFETFISLVNLLKLTVVSSYSIMPRKLIRFSFGETISRPNYQNHFIRELVTYYHSAPLYNVYIYIYTAVPTQNPVRPNSRVYKHKYTHT